MLTSARKFLLFLVIAVVLNVAAHIFYFMYPMTQKGHKQISNKRYHRVVPSMDWKVLYNNIVCNNTATRQMSEAFSLEVKNLSLDTATGSTFKIYAKNAKDDDDLYKLCPPVPPGLGPVAKDNDIMHLHGIDEMYLKIESGGFHTPSECIPQQQIAVVVAVHETNNSTRRHIGSFIYYMHPFLMKQQIEYQLFVVLKKKTTSSYERGKLFNIGYVEAQTYRNEGWDCFIFHDAHLVPLDTRNLYRCSKNPRRLITDLRMPRRFGGAIAISPHDFAEINGFSNLIWSSDDDYIDMYKRLIAANLTVERNVDSIGTYATFDYLFQANTEPISKKYNATNYKFDGLSNLFYEVSELKLKQFYTLIEVESEDYQGKQKLF